MRLTYGLLTKNEIKDTQNVVRKQLASSRETVKLDDMSKETRLRVIIILALLVGYVVVAVLRSGTAW